AYIVTLPVSGTVDHSPAAANPQAANVSSPIPKRNAMIRQPCVSRFSGNYTPAPSRRAAADRGRRSPDLVRRPQRHAPVAVRVLLHVDLPRAAAHGAVLDVRLPRAAAFVDPHFDGLAAIRAAARHRLVHRAQFPI